MLTGMGVIDRKFAKGGRKFKKTKHCTIPPNLEKMKSEKTSRIRKRGHLLGMDNEKRKRHHNEKYAERCKKIDGKVPNLQSREIKDESRRQECKLSVKSG